MAKTYQDQEFYEIYDNYDLESGEEVPEMIQNARVIREGVVDIDYPVVNGIWSLEGEKGRAPFYGEAGKKAFVRNDYYFHPYKKWSSRIVYMTPLEYIEAAADIFSNADRVITPEILIASRVDDYDLNKVFNPLKGDLFYLVLDERRGTQEGLHRAVWAMMNEDEVVPVIVIEK